MGEGRVSKRWERGECLKDGRGESVFSHIEKLPDRKKVKFLLNFYNS